MHRRLIVARHGNTFEPNETPRRVGGRTDIPLVATGRDQAARLGDYLRNYNLFPDRVIAADLMRTRETAKLACDITKPELDTRFNEIDYGPDENREEAEVIARIGEQAIKDWNDNAIPPMGWNIDTNRIIHDWFELADDITATPHTNTLIVTSNGIARFAPYITNDFPGFAARFPLKLATGAFGVLEHDGSKWSVTQWNIRP